MDGFGVNFDSQIAKICLECDLPECINPQHCKRYLRMARKIVGKPDKSQRNEEAIRRVKLYRYNGKEMTLHEWAACVGIKYDTLKGRIRKGMTFAQAISTPVIVYDSDGVEFNGETQKLSAWCKLYGLEYSTVKWRLRNGWSLDRALTTPAKNNIAKNEEDNPDEHE